MKNNPRIEFTNSFNTQRKNAPLEIKEAFLETLALFLEEPNNPFLRNHALRGKLAGYRSLDVTNDWRAIFKETQVGELRVIKFFAIGTHKNLYGNNS